MAHITTKQPIVRKLSATPDAAWQAILDVGHLDEWFPLIATCEVVGSGVGARREMTIDGGMGDMVDEVIDIDHDARTLRYRRTLSPFPVSSYVGTVEVFRSYDGQAVVSWTVDFASEPDAAPGVADLLAMAIGDGLAGMDAALAG